MFSQISSPSVIVDLDIVDKNIQSMSEIAKKAGIKHRPHIKTHKSVYFAKKQQEAGAVGITCAKLGEAEVMAEAGFNDILIAFPLIGEEKLERLYQLAQKIKVSTCIDSIEGAKGISEVGLKLGKPIPVFIEVEGGNLRCGRQPGKDTVDFAQQVNRLQGIRIIGILTYAGQIYGVKNIEDIRAMAIEEAANLKNTVEMLQESGIAVQEISAGSSISSKFASELKGVTEIRAGNYIFHDLSQLTTGMVTVDECALRIIATVVSTPAPGRAVIDAGSKTLTTDTTQFRQGHGYIIEYPDIEIYKLNEEHGFLRFDPSIQLSVGQRITIIPNHACVVANLTDEFIGVRGDQIVEVIPVEARGKNK